MSLRASLLKFGVFVVVFPEEVLYTRWMPRQHCWSNRQTIKLLLTVISLLGVSVVVSLKIQGADFLSVLIFLFLAIK